MRTIQSIRSRLARRQTLTIDTYEQKLPEQFLATNNPFGAAKLSVLHVRTLFGKRSVLRLRWCLSMSMVPGCLQTLRQYLNGLRWSHPDSDLPAQDPGIPWTEFALYYMLLSGRHLPIKIRQDKKWLAYQFHDSKVQQLLPINEERSSGHLQSRSNGWLSISKRFQINSTCRITKKLDPKVFFYAGIHPTEQL